MRPRRDATENATRISVDKLVNSTRATVVYIGSLLPGVESPRPTEPPMDKAKLLDRITVNPGIFGGKPIIRGRRLAVRHVLRDARWGRHTETIQAGYPWLEPEDIRACLVYAHRLRRASTPWAARSRAAGRNEQPVAPLPRRSQARQCLRERSASWALRRSSRIRSASGPMTAPTSRPRRWIGCGARRARAAVRRSGAGLERRCQLIRRSSFLVYTN